MARFEEFKVTSRRNPSRFGMLGAALIFSVYLVNYQGPALTPVDARLFVPALLLADRDVEIVDGEGAAVEQRSVGHAPHSVMAFEAGASATGDQCIGGAAVLAVPLRLFGPGGAHLFYALIPAILSLLIYGMTVRVFGRRWLAFCAQLLAGVNPFMLSYQSLHPAFLATTLVAAVMYLLMEPARHDLLLGMLYGALVGVENAALIFAPVILLMLATDQSKELLSRITAGGLVLLGFVLALAPALYWKEVAFGSILIHPREALPGSAALFHHSFLGWEFDSAVLFNYPLRDSVVRTPHFPFPTFLGMPMALARGFGLILVATFFLGIGPLNREDRRLTRFLLSWVVVAYLWWGFQEDWDEQRMASAMIIAPAAVLLMAAGILRFARFAGFRSNAIALVVVTGALLVMIKGTFFMEFPVDPRWTVRHSDAALNNSGLDGLPTARRLDPAFHTTLETRDEIIREKLRFATGNLLPSAYLPTRWAPGEALNRLLEAFRNPSGYPVVPQDLLVPSRAPPHSL
ncbi:MAG: hypothetical protein ABIK09_00015 [Pseudomonadota bacterium]